MRKSSGLLTGIIGRLLFWVNLLAIVWLLLCYVAGYISPEYVKYLALLSLTSPFAILVNVFFFFFWFFGRKKLRAIFPLLALAFVYKMVFTIFGIHFFDENITEKKPEYLKIMSWNVHVMGFAVYPVDKEAPKEITRIVKEEAPDILCMPEFCAYNENLMKPFTKQIIDAGYKEFRFTLDGESSWLRIGTALFSKYPISNFTAMKINDIVSCSFCDVQLPDSVKVRMLIVHLRSFLLNGDERDVMKEIKKTLDQKDQATYLNKFYRAYQNRAYQADSLARVIENSPYPVVVCGDFNDMPASYVYTTIKGKKLNDAFIEKGKGIGRTYNEVFPTLRIDNIFYDPSVLEIKGYKSFATPYSDHNPIIANFSLKPQAEN